MQYELGSELESLVGGGLSIQNGKRHRIFVALAVTQVLEHVEPTLEVVAVHNHSVKLFRGKDFTAGAGAPAYLHLHGQFLQRRANHANDLLVAAQEEGDQGHGRCDGNPCARSDESNQGGCPGAPKLFGVVWKTVKRFFNA